MPNTRCKTEFYGQEPLYLCAATTEHRKKRSFQEEFLAFL